MAMLILGILAAMAAVMLVGWTCQRAANNGGWTDVFWTYGTGAACAVAALIPLGEHPGAGWRRMMVAAMMALWALRLGSYVALRVARSPEDARYADLRQEWGQSFQRNMFGLLFAQAPLTAVIGVAVLFAARQPDATFRLWDALGLLVFVVAILGETLSDRQMQAFKADKANHGKVCDIGLWSWSRHPNYFFEALIWIAYPLIGVDPARPWSLTALIAPVMMFAIVRYGTGVPPLEKAMLKSKGEAYRRYQAEVSPLILRPRRSAAD
jgi:steroid 5-alpha reductase family enzyme